MKLPSDLRRSWINAEDALSISRQCELLGISKGSLYYQPIGESPYNLELMEQIDRQYLETPFYGSRRMCAHLSRQGYKVNRKRVQRLMRLMGIETVYPGPNLSKRNQEHKIYPYLLRDITVDRVNFVWSTDITYIPVQGGFIYLMAIMDWYSRYVLNWELSNTQDSTFCTQVLEEALENHRPEIFNTDQGCQFTSKKFLTSLQNAGVKISMDGKGRALDNVFVERLWRSVKYEEVYLRSYSNVREAKQSLSNYFTFYNTTRLHQMLGYKTPKEIYHENLKS